MKTSLQKVICDSEKKEKDTVPCYILPIDNSEWERAFDEHV
jgi:hypothetical protein